MFCFSENLNQVYYLGFLFFYFDVDEDFNDDSNDDDD